MTFGLMGMGISIMTLMMLMFIFTLEERRGQRFGERARTFLDECVVKVQAAFLSLFSYIVRDLKLTLHYLFHKFLSLFLRFLEWFETHIKMLMRSNKKSAHKSMAEPVVRNKLHEIADHKAHVALSEEEKRRHKKEMLQNG